MKSFLHHRFIPFLAFLAISVLLVQTRCAHPVAPTGGPKDEIPPMVTATSPQNYSTRFQDKRIVIEFNEFIQLKDQAKEIFISPPMTTKPEMVVRGKNLVIELKEDVRQDMTYVMNFGNAIVDITESNPVSGFSYVFSTGDMIDSMEIAGKILDAFDLSPVEDVLCIVYYPGQDTIPADSMFLKIPPLSAVRTDEEGSFRLTNLPDAKYLVYGLEDLNNNFYYDLPTERIAFLDSLFTPEYIPTEKDTLEAEDSADIVLISPGAPTRPVTLYLFQEFDPVQRILSSSMTSAGSMMFVFRLPLEKYEITPVNFEADSNWMMIEHNEAKDTLVIWPLETERDTFELFVNVGDTISDTITLIRRDKDAGRSSRRSSTSEKKLEIGFNINGGKLPPGRSLRLTASEPLTAYDFTKFMLFGPRDTLVPDVKLTGDVKREAIISYPWEYNESYRLLIPDSIMTGISGAMNDSISLKIRMVPLEDYGTVIVNYKVPGGTSQLLVELVNEKGGIVQKDTLTSDRRITYRYLQAATYRLKAVYDKNANGKWDTGDLMQQILPERVVYFAKDITVRSNWELQEEWLLDE